MQPDYAQDIRLIVCDLDGTLLAPDKRITPASLQAVRAARQRGIFVTICSGRIHTMLEAYSRQLAISGPLVAANGALIIDAETQKVLFEKPIEKAAAARVMEYVKEAGMDYSALTPGVCYFSQNSVRRHRFEQYNQIARKNGLREITIEPFNEGHRNALSQSIFKLLVYELQPGQFEAAVRFLHNEKDIAYTSSDEGLLDISAVGVSKGEGVRQLAALLGVEKQQICVFGDYLNDLSMFRVAGLPIAMGNANATLKEQAAFITRSNAEDGVAWAIENLILHNPE